MRILLVQRGHIGDMVCLTPTIRLISKHLPGSQIAVLGNSYNVAVLANNSDLCEVFVYEKQPLKNWKNRLRNAICFLKLKSKIRHWQPDVAIVACGYYDYHALSSLRKMGIRHVIGFKSIDDKPAPKISFDSPAFDSIHEVEAIAKLLKPIGITASPGPMQVFPNKAIQAEINIRFQLQSKPNIAIHISGRTPEKQWGESNFRVLLGHLLNDSRYANVVVIWAPSSNSTPQSPQGDDKFAEDLSKSFINPRLKLIATHNLEELIAVLSLCHLYIGADGGAMHLACASGLSVVALFDSLPNTLNHWYPWQVPHEVLARDAGKIQLISPAEVQSAAERLLAKL